MADARLDTSSTNERSRRPLLASWDDMALVSAYAVAGCVLGPSATANAFAWSTGRAATGLKSMPALDTRSLTLGCGGLATPAPDESDVGSLPGGADRRGIGQEMAVARASSAVAAESGLGKTSSALAISVGFPIDNRRSLFVSDASIVGQITLKDVLTKLAGSTSGALTLYRKFWDLQNDAGNGVTERFSEWQLEETGPPFLCSGAEGLACVAQSGPARTDAAV